MLLKKTIYLREEDLELWESCPNKSLLIHNALAGAPAGHMGLNGVRANEQPALYDQAIRQAVKAFAGDCKHPNVNKRTGICPDCGEYTR